MKKLRWLLAGVALTGSLICFEANGQDFYGQPNQTAEYYGSQDEPSQYQQISYDQETQPACDSFGDCASGCDSCGDSNCGSNCDSCCLGGICANTELLIGG